MQYCILVWGSTYPSNLNRIALLQKRMIRIVYKTSYAHTYPIFNELEILPFNKIYLFHLGLFMYQFHNCMLPSNFDEYFTCVNHVHNYNTRQSNLFFLPIWRTNRRKFAIIYQGPKFIKTPSPKIYMKLHPSPVFGKNLKNIYSNFNFVLFKHTINVTISFYLCSVKNLIPIFWSILPFHPNFVCLFVCLIYTLYLARYAFTVNTKIHTRNFQR
jgi:hypothetical protein